jgi:hypothetical protein
MSLWFGTFTITLRMCSNYYNIHVRSLSATVVRGGRPGTRSLRQLFPPSSVKLDTLVNPYDISTDFDANARDQTKHNLEVLPQAWVQSFLLTLIENSAQRARRRGGSSSWKCHIGAFLVGLTNTTGCACVCVCSRSTYKLSSIPYVEDCTSNPSWNPLLELGPPTRATPQTPASCKWKTWGKDGYLAFRDVCLF